MKKTLCVLMLLLIFMGNAIAMSEKERVEDAQTIINLFAQQYGPLKWKEEIWGIDFAQLSEKFLTDAANAENDKEFYRVVALFLSQFKDAHVSYSIPSSLVAKIPFEVEYFNDGVVITEIDRKLLPEETFPVEVGDKLIAVDGVPVEKIIDSLIPFRETGHEPTNRKFTGTTYLTYRPQENFLDIPSGVISVTTISKKNSTGKTSMVEWIREGADLAEMPPKSAVSYIAKAMMPTIIPDIFEEETFLERMRVSQEIEVSQREMKALSLGSTSTFFPLWDGFETRHDAPNLIGTFVVKDHRIGFIRVPRWFIWDWDVFEREISYLNDNTEALIIDQTNNPGGHGCDASKLASFFITSVKGDLKFQVRANRDWLSSLERLFLNSRNEENIHAKEWISTLRTAVTNGDHLSAPLSICNATGQFFPYKDKNNKPIVYMRPVMVLINELDFSAADMFPVIVKDWGVARLFGTRTAGAGGNVVGAEFIGHSETAIRLTQSLMYRAGETDVGDGKMTHYIENVGVAPDYEYQVTSKDYYDGYKAYRQAIEDVVLSLISEKQ